MDRLLNAENSLRVTVLSNAVNRISRKKMQEKSVPSLRHLSSLSRLSLGWSAVLGWLAVITLVLDILVVDVEGL